MSIINSPTSPIFLMMWYEVATLALGCFCAYMLLLMLFPSFRKKWFAWLYSNYLYPAIEEALRPHKEELLRGMQTITSKDPELHKEGAIRVLEIGVGHGGNLQFYSVNCRLIGVDVNPDFKKYFEDRKKKVCPPGVTVEKLICCSAEDMKEIPDKSIDVVVGTYVFCFIPNQEAAVAEIKRVLAPGGHYFFLEHVMCPAERNWVIHLVQDLVQPFWYYIMAGCRVNRPQITPQLVEFGFSSISRQLRMVPMPWFAFMVSPTEMGTAIK